MSERGSVVRAVSDTESVSRRYGFHRACRARDRYAAQTAAKYHLGGYILFGRDFDGLTADEVKANIQSYQDASEIPMLIGTDEEGGTVVRVSSSLRDEPFMSPRDYYTSGGWEAVEGAEEEKADLLLSLGINVNLAPVCDVTGDPDLFMYERSFSGDADEVSEFVGKTVGIYRSKKLGSKDGRHLPLKEARQRAKALPGLRRQLRYPHGHYR